jgi:hypothetical protein
MQDYVKLAGGAVCTAVEANEADLRGVQPHYARVFIPAASRVRVTVEVGDERQVVFDGSIAPESRKASVLEIRLRRHVDVEALPAQPKGALTKMEAEIGM